MNADSFSREGVLAEGSNAGSREKAPEPPAARDGIKIIERTHEAYPDPLGGGYDGYKGKCWDCGWAGRVQEPGPDGKRLARREAGEHEARAGRVLEVPLQVFTMPEGR